MKTVKSTFSLSFFLKRNAQKANGNMPVIARITINGAVAQFSTKLEIAPNLWNVKMGKVTGRSNEAVQINNILDGIRAKIQSHYHSLLAGGRGVTAEILKNSFLGIDDSYETVLTIFDKHNADLKKLVGVDKSDSTYKKYLLARQRVAEFIRYRYKMTDMQLRNMDLMFVKDYEVFLKTECRLSHNVAAKMIQYLKKMVTFAHNTGIIQHHPFTGYVISVKKVDKGYLSEQELKTIIGKQFDCLRLEHIKDIFLFACYTGLSYIDIANLQKSNICQSFDGKMWLIGKRGKTGISYNVPLFNIPLMIIEKYKGKLSDGKVLPVISNQKLNSYLKEIADLCGIATNLTFHLARHRKSFNYVYFNTLQS
ncbi:MAG: site-specific integrase [Dysgonamonadaceae bacterium]|jgi:integrase|nr:site-specific integrase [Dysgonamonadaceae bacterium]